MNDPSITTSGHMQSRWGEQASNWQANMYACLKQEVMVDAVRAEDGQTYSLAAIQQWFDTGKRTSPMTGVAMGTRLVPDEAVRRMVGQEWARQARL